MKGTLSSKIDRLKEEAIELRTFMFFILGAILILFGGLGSLCLRFISSNSPLITIGIFVLLMLLLILGIIHLRYKDKYDRKLDELEKEE